MSDARRLTADDVLTIAEAAELLHMPPSTVADLARRGAIPSVKVGRRRIVLRPELARLLYGRSDARSRPSGSHEW
jgi:excisionase family DNA binding protein